MFTVLNLYRLLIGTGFSCAFFATFPKEQALNVAQKTLGIFSVFTIDKTPKICGAAPDYSTFLKGAASYEINSDSRRYYLQHFA